MGDSQQGLRGTFLCTLGPDMTLDTCGSDATVVTNRIAGLCGHGNEMRRWCRSGQAWGLLAFLPESIRSVTGPSAKIPSPTPRLAPP